MKLKVRQAQKSEYSISEIILSDVQRKTRIYKIVLLNCRESREKCGQSLQVKQDVDAYIYVCTWMDACRMQ